MQEADLEALKKDRDQLWAEAVHLYESGQQWHLTDREEVLLREAQTQYQAEDPWMQPLAECRQRLPTQSLMATQWRSCSFDALKKEKVQHTKYDEMRVATCLTALGFEKRRRMVMATVPYDGTLFKKGVPCMRKQHRHCLCCTYCHTYHTYYL